MSKKQSLLAISDLHLGVQRNGGTTISSAEALREYGHRFHRGLLELADDGTDVLVNGDLADTFSIPLTEAIEIYVVAAEFLQTKPNSSLTWALGNHDLSKNSQVLGSVAFMGRMLAMRFPDRFRLIDAPALLSEGVYVIPHCANQDLFELELSKVPVGVRFLFLHCNFDSKFAQQADHSLDLSRDQAKALKARGITMILGHEHQQRDSLGGAVLVVGNQFASSVSDCLGNETKRCVMLEDGGVSFIQTWSPDDAEGWFAETDWRDLKGIEEEGRGFVRVVGKASAEEAADVVKAISAFRQRSQSFVVTNAVQLEQLEGLDEVSTSVEELRSLSVLDMLLEMLDPEQRIAIEKLTTEAA